MFSFAIFLKPRRRVPMRTPLQSADADAGGAKNREDDKWTRLLERIRRYEYPIAENAA